MRHLSGKGPKTCHVKMYACSFKLHFMRMVFNSLGILPSYPLNPNIIFKKSKYACFLGACIFQRQRCLNANRYTNKLYIKLKPTNCSTRPAKKFYLVIKNSNDAKRRNGALFQKLARRILKKVTILLSCDQLYII